VEKRGLALAAVDTKRCFQDSMKMVQLLNKYDATSLGELVSVYGALGVLLSFSGFSLKFGNKLIEYGSKGVSQHDGKAWLRYDFYILVHRFLSGDWHNSPSCEEALIERYLHAGEFFSVGGLIIWSGFMLIEQGDFEQAGKCINKLEEIGTLYDHDYNLDRKYLLQAILYFKRRNFSAALDIIKIGVPFAKKLGQDSHAFWLLSIKAQILLLTDKVEEAKQMLTDPKFLGVGQKRILPLFRGCFLICQLLYDLMMIEQHVQTSGAAKMTILRKKALRSGRAALRNAEKCALFKVESYKLMGVYYWLAGKQNKAFKWWDKSIRTGEQLKTRLELARTYIEVGKRLLEPKSKYREWKGVSAEGYLEKARALFEELEQWEPEWDLEQLEKIKIASNASVFSTKEPKEQKNWFS
jgi:tetratricopeptide (TPR) repeat protein